MLRAAVVVLALICCAWFALGARQAGQISEASGLIMQPKALTPAQEAHAASLLRAAEWLDPGTEVELLRARLAIRERALARAKRIAEDVVHKEPMNLAAWLQLARVAGAAGDRQTVLLALRHISELYRKLQ